MLVSKSLPGSVRGTLDPVKKALPDSKIDKSNVHEILLVSGSTYIPCIVKLVSDFFNGKEPNKRMPIVPQSKLPSFPVTGDTVHL